MSRMNTRQATKPTRGKTILRRLKDLFAPESLRGQAQMHRLNQTAAAKPNLVGAEGATIINLASRRERSNRPGRSAKKRRSGLSAADEKRIRDLAALLRRPRRDGGEID